LTRAEATALWEERKEDRVAAQLGKSFPPNCLGARWPGPDPRHPWVKEVRVDLRIVPLRPQTFEHQITFKGKDWRRPINIPDHLQLSQEAVAPIFFVVLHPERKDLGIQMPEIKRITEDGLWGFRSGEDLVLFSRRDGTWRYGEISTDARLLYLRRQEDKVTGFALAEATLLRVGSETRHEAKRRVTAAGPPLVTDDGGEWRSSGPMRGMP